MVASTVPSSRPRRENGSLSDSFAEAGNGPPPAHRRRRQRRERADGRRLSACRTSHDGDATGPASAAMRVAGNGSTGASRHGEAGVPLNVASMPRQAGGHSHSPPGRPTEPHHRSSRLRPARPRAVQRSDPGWPTRRTKTRQPAPVHSAPGQRAASIAAAGQAGSPTDDSRCASRNRRRHRPHPHRDRLRCGVPLILS